MNLPEERTVFLEKDNLFVNTTSNNPKEVEYLTALQRFNKKRDNYYSMTPIEQTREQIAQNAIKEQQNSFLGQVPRALAGTTVSSVLTLGRLGVGAMVQAFNDVRYAYESTNLVDQNTVARINLKRENYNTDEEYQAAQAQFDKQYKAAWQRLEDMHKNVDSFAREQMQEMKERHENWLKLSGLSKEESDGFLYDLTAGGASLLMAIGTAFVTKSPAATAAVFGAIQGRQSYEEALQNGVAPEKAEKIGFAAGAVEAILEKVGLDVFLRGLKARGIFTKIAKNSLTEAVQEGSQGAANEIIMQNWGGKEADILQTLQEVGMQALIGGIIGGGTTGAHISVEVAVKRLFPQTGNQPEKGETMPGPTLEQAEQLVRANEGRELTPQERFGIILNNGQRKLESLGVPTDKAQKMLATVILRAGSQESLNEVQQMLNDENNPSTYKDGDILAATKEYAEAVRATKKELTPEYRKQVYDIRDQVREDALTAGYSEDEAEAAANMQEAFAQLAYQISGEAPNAWYARNRVQFVDQRVKTEDTSFDFGNNAQQPEQTQQEQPDAMETYNGPLPDDVYYQTGWHGTPHRFDKFSTKHMGAGEGAQAHGWGLYFAANKKISEKYRKALRQNYVSYDEKNFPANSLENFILRRFMDIKEDFDVESAEEAKQILLDSIADGIVVSGPKTIKQALDFAKDLDPQKIKEAKGQLYKVEIPENNVLLDEQKKMGKQSKYVQTAITELLAKNKLHWPWKDMKGSMFYSFLVFKLGNSRKASEMLNKFGIQGITYKGKQDGRCYVIFDDKAIKILETYYQGEQNPLGQTAFTQTGAIITLLEGANKTTLLHELGHVFLRDFERLAAENDNAITRHYTQVIESFLGKKEGSRWSRPQQEKFARTFLEYIRTKEVPEAPEMRSVFDRFKDWLQEIYDAIDGTQFFEKNVSQEAKDFFNEVLTPQAVEAPNAAKFRGKVREIRQAVQDIKQRRLPRAETGLLLQDIKGLYGQIKQRMPKVPKTDLLKDLRKLGANYANAGRVDKEAYKNARIPDKKEGIGDDPARWLTDKGYMSAEDAKTYKDQDLLNSQAYSLIERALNGEKVYKLEDQAIAEQRENFKENLEMVREVAGSLEEANEVLRNINEMERKGYRVLDRDDVHYLEGKLKAAEEVAGSELDKLEGIKTEIVDEIKKRVDADQLEAYLARISAAKNKDALIKATRCVMLAIEKSYTNRALYTQHLLQSPRQNATVAELVEAWNVKSADTQRADEILSKKDGVIKEYLKDAFVSISDRLRRIDGELARRIEDLPRKRVMRNSRYRQYFGDYIAFIYRYVAKNKTDFEILSWAQMNGNEHAENEIAQKYKDIKLNGKNLPQLIKEKNEGLQKIWEEGVNAGLSIGWLEGYNPRRMASSDAFIEYLQKTEQWSHIERVLKIMGVDKGTAQEKAMAINKYFRGFEPKDLAAAKPGNIRRRDIMYVSPALAKFYKNSFEALVDYSDDMAKAISIKEVFGISEKNIEDSVGKLVLDIKAKYNLSHREEKLIKDAITAFVRPAKASQVVRGIKTFSYLTTITNFISTISQLEDIGFAMAQWGHANAIRAFGKRNTKEWVKLEQIGAEVFDVDMRKERENFMDKGLRKLLGINGFTAMDRLGKETYVNADFQARQKQAKKNPARLQKELEKTFSAKEAQEVVAALKEGNINHEGVQSLLYYDLSAVQPMSLLDMPERYALGGGGYKLLYQLKSFAARRANYLYTRTQEQFHSAQTPEEYAKAITETLRFFSLLVGYGAMTNLLKNFLMGRALDVTDELLDTLLQNAMVTRYMIKRGKQDPMNALVNAIMPPAVGTANDLWQDIGRVISGKKGISQMNIWSRLPVVGKPYYWWFGGGKAITEKDNKEKGLFKIKGWAGK